MTALTWSLNMGNAVVSPLRQAGRAAVNGWKEAPHPSHGEAANVMAGLEECHFCYRVLFALRGLLNNCFSRLWLGLLLLYGLVIAPQFAFARSVGSGFGAAALRRAGWGPLHVAVQSPIQQKRLGFIHESPALNAPGSWELRTGVTLANQWILEDGKLIIDEGVRPWSNPMGAAQFGSTFFMITGFHGMHVTAGVIYLVVIARRVKNGFYEERGGNYEIVEITGLYWHFVDLVWVFIFAFFYLW